MGSLAEAAGDDFWHTNLANVSKITGSFIESLSRENLPIKATMSRGYKFFHESYIHSTEGGPKIESFTCTCAVGKGLCQHTTGLLYSMSHFQLLGLKSIPPIISKTSLPQTWHIPKRLDGIQPRPLSEVIVEKLTCPTDNPPKKRKKVSGVSQKLYKPFHESLEELNIIAALAPLIGNTCPESGFLRIWPEEEQDTLLVQCKFGVVQKDLSYHISNHPLQTAAMKYGLQHEDEVVEFYAQHFGRNVVKVGFVIDPSVPHLGCSPDRRVYDPSESSSWGLFEIKCSMAEELKDVKYLKKKVLLQEFTL
ncbi:hypothetical protein P5673_012037 [Acropora cervicornis]|uniref:SWIM-type domain-containing protein n=1 Tax=Acropora cervicornis TaxID=6130 RepID=A0AAD9QP65_ACRCE|nr:hypothetical protein P5673_012037 [Acropora cervicornis]